MIKLNTFTLECQSCKYFKNSLYYQLIIIINNIRNTEMLKVEYFHTHYIGIINDVYTIW